VGVIALGGFFVRSATVMATQNIDLVGDAWDYDRLGQLIAAGKGFGPSLLSPSGGTTAFRPPLYPLFLGGIYKVTSESLVAARLVQAALGAAAVALVWLIARRLFDRRAAFVATVLTAVYPPLVLASAAPMSESVFIPIMLTGVLATLIAREQRRAANRWAVLAGVCVGLGWLARPSSLAMLPALLLLALAWKRTNWRPAVALRRTVVILGAAAVVLLPWQLRNTANLHHLVFVSDIDGYNVAGLYNVDASAEDYPTHYQWRPPIGVAELAPLFADRSLDEVTLGAKLRTSGVEFVKQNPTAPLEAELWNSYRMLELTGLDHSAEVAEQSGYERSAAVLAMVSFWVVGTLAVAGTMTPSFRRAPWALWLAPALLWVGTALFLGDARQRAPIEPFILLAAALIIADGITSVSALSARRRSTL
jgi:4-amino-4-deoxy-L-arabinose transferase-like glycosyltransferase